MGSWKYVSADNFDAFLKELGINVVLRKLASLANPTVVFTRCDDAGMPKEVWTMRYARMNGIERDLYAHLKGW